jgi:putative membrane protein
MTAAARWPLLLAGLAGLAAVAALIAGNDAGAVIDAALAVGWGLVPVLALRAVPILCDTRGWHVLFDPRPSFGAVAWIRWVSESVNALLPVAQIGGEVVRARLVSRPRLVAAHRPGSGEAAATVIVDLTTGLVATALFSLLGLILLLLGPGDSGLGRGIAAAAGVLVLMTAGIVALQKGRGLSRFAALIARRLARPDAFTTEVRAMEAGFARLWAAPRTLAVSTLWRFLSFLTSAVEVWLVLRLLGHPVSAGDAVMLEALSTAARSAAFAVPGGLGIQEGSLLVLGGLAGVPAPAMLGLALVKRVREVLTGAPALALWWWTALRPKRALSPAR